MLVFPHASGESLLGRAVTASEGGGFRIADARAPGCDVTVRKTSAQYKTHRDIRASQLASVGGGYQQIVSFEARYGKDSQASLDLENHEILEADVRGPCGDRIVNRVYVGKGKRRVFAASQGAAGATVVTPVPGLSAGPKGESKNQDTDEIAWDSDQAYAFEVTEPARPAPGSTASANPGLNGEPLEISVKVPSIIQEGEDLRIVFEAPKPAWLVVYYVDADGKGDVLWPSNEEPTPKVGPGKPAVLPSPAELAAGIHIRPTAPKGAQTARESLVVYAFGDKRDFDVMKPSAGGSNADGTAYADELQKRLRDVPTSRWTRTRATYTIQSKAGGK